MKAVLALDKSIYVRVSFLDLSKCWCMNFVINTLEKNIKVVLNVSWF